MKLYGRTGTVLVFVILHGAVELWSSCIELRGKANPGDWQQNATAPDVFMFFGVTKFIKKELIKSIFLFWLQLVLVYSK